MSGGVRQRPPQGHILLCTRLEPVSTTRQRLTANQNEDAASAPAKTGTARRGGLGLELFDDSASDNGAAATRAVANP